MPPVLPGADAGQADLAASGMATTSNARTAPDSGTSSSGTASDRLLGPSVTDPARTGGLADALRRSGVRLPQELARTADAFTRR
ncbi:MAG TPA: hypothetical protein VNA20_07320 [Frankiaceae bacterium]|nr:hypothetical protein [Frankiaceae bacterium]